MGINLDREKKYPESSLVYRKIHKIMYVYSKEVKVKLNEEDNCQGTWENREHIWGGKNVVKIYYTHVWECPSKTKYTVSNDFIAHSQITI